MRSVKSTTARSRARHPHAQRAPPFLKVQDLERQIGNFRLLATMTQMGKSARKFRSPAGGDEAGENRLNCHK